MEARRNEGLLEALDELPPYAGRVRRVSCTRQTVSEHEQALGAGPEETCRWPAREGRSETDPVDGGLVRRVLSTRAAPARCGTGAAGRGKVAVHREMREGRRNHEIAPQQRGAYWRKPDPLNAPILLTRRSTTGRLGG